MNEILYLNQYCTFSKLNKNNLHIYWFPFQAHNNNHLPGHKMHTTEICLYWALSFKVIFHIKTLYTEQ